MADSGRGAERGKNAVREPHEAADALQLDVQVATVAAEESITDDLENNQAQLRRFSLKNFTKWSMIDAVGTPIALSQGNFLLPMKIFHHGSDHDILRVHEYHPNVRYVIDLSNTEPPYLVPDSTALTYRKIKFVSKECPSEEKVDEFRTVVKTLLAGKENTGIAVHCHYGFNRTGFLLAAYLYKERSHTIFDAVDAFRTSRPPGIKHKHFVDELVNRYSENDGKGRGKGSSNDDHQSQPGG